MLQSVKELRGYSIQATDGEIGKVDDVYFDDIPWVVRYLVVKTGGWLSGRKVLLSQVALQRPDAQARHLPVSLTKEEVKDSPDIDTDMPVYRQHEVELHDYYGWAPYWGNLTSPANVVPPIPVPFQPTREGTVAPPPAVDAGMHRKTPAPQKTEVPAAQRDQHLRSMNEVSGYHIRARDGDLGHVETFIVEDKNWAVIYLVADTGNWLPGKKVLLSVDWVKSIDWSERDVEVDLLQKNIKDSPEYDPDAPLNRAYETALHEHYGRSPYWESGDT
ncbi:MAG: PRC-barrel domain-containing protein [Anaerolineales bacterium]|nr:PRC-barrel domain-containing protein [Anaerolineales bacterium]